MGIKRLGWFIFTFAEKMVGDSREGESCQEFLDLIPNERDWLVRDRGSFRVTEEKKLELGLGPLGFGFPKKTVAERDTSLLGIFQRLPRTTILLLNQRWIIVGMSTVGFNCTIYLFGVNV
ncbi:uncharacterized protein LOC131252931 [Magnolia sinica]|uniref:uncharacterized protein LOC131252931 n=1 Tax=Magnolia sinica TaxID=86752 RepID=UPI002659C199|nr:uncharacterized protein LOC131252931 [Magnolia sinica]